MARRGCGALLLLSVLIQAGCSGGEPEGELRSPSKPPNILFIVLDDLGYNDLGINSGAIGQTPNLNHFAEQGVRFTRNYVDSTCSATRAGILSGMPPAALGFRPDGLGITPETITLPEALQAAGYTTHHVGKWHLGHASLLSWPHNQGYDSFFGFLSQFLLKGPHKGGKLKLGRPTYLDPWLQRDDQAPMKQQGHLTDLLVQDVLQFLDSANDRDPPWFLSYWTYLPHTPVQPGESFASRYPDTPEGRYMAMLAQMDDAMGQVFEALDRNKLNDNTLVMVVSDNGGTGRVMDNNAPFKGVKTTFTEGGVRTPLLVRWPGGLGAGRVANEIVSYLDYFPTLTAAAGAETPAHLSGRDIRPLMSGGEVESMSLKWDTGNSEYPSWSILSADGRWRLNRFYTWPPVLNDLEEDLTGGGDVSQREPERLGLLHREFLVWRDQQRHVKINYEALDERGAARLTGESLQRAPGFGGYTFAMAVLPEEYRAGSDEPVQILAAQQGQWQLSLADGELLLDINGIHLRSPAPEAGKCTALVVTAEHVWNGIQPSHSKARVELYLDGKMQAQALAPLRHYPPDTYTEPTWVGQNSVGKHRFLGVLGQPLILNEHIRVDEESDPWVANGLSRVSNDLCAGLDSRKVALGHK